MSYKIGTKEKPMKLKTPPLTSEYTMHTEEKDGKEILVCTVGKTILHYNINCIDDLHSMLKKHGDWMELGSAGGNSRSLGSFFEESCWWLVRTEERTPRTIWNVCSSSYGKIGTC